MVTLALVSFGILGIVEVYMSWLICRISDIKNFDETSNKFKRVFAQTDKTLKGLTGIDFAEKIMFTSYNTIDKAVFSTTINKLLNSILKFKMIPYLMIGLLFPILISKCNAQLYQIIISYAIFAFITLYSIRFDTVTDYLSVYDYDKVNTTYFMISRIYYY